MRAAATALALAVLTIPATAFDPAHAPIENLGSARPEQRPTAPEKTQDRIAPAAPLRVAFLPELIPSAPPAKSAFGWNANLDAQIARHAMANGVPI